MCDAFIDIHISSIYLFKLCNIFTLAIVKKKILNAENALSYFTSFERH